MGSSQSGQGSTEHHGRCPARLRHTKGFPWPSMSHHAVGACLGNSSVRHTQQCSIRCPELLLLWVNAAMATFPRALVSVALLLTLVSCTLGRQHYRARFPNGHAVPCPPDQDCAGEICVGVGHLSCLGGAVEPRRNAFGQVRVSRHELGFWRVA